MNDQVAPYTGAWIEKCNIDKAESALKVAPYTGAWIEIDLQEKYKTDTEVAPYTGAWIEIYFSLSGCAYIRSLPTRERGLKSRCRLEAEQIELSLPTRERGLKFVPQYQCQ